MTERNKKKKERNEKRTGERANLMATLLQGNQIPLPLDPSTPPLGELPLSLFRHSQEIGKNGQHFGAYSMIWCTLSPAIPNR